MDISSLRTLAFDSSFNTFGVPALVTPPNASTIEAIGIWVEPLVDDLPAGQDLQRRTLGDCRAFRIAQAGASPRGTSIIAARRGESSRTWKVDGIERLNG